jgi:adenylate cyclase, class 2
MEPGTGSPEPKAESPEPNMIEREIKLQFESAGEARTAILAAGAAPLKCRRLQEDALFDTSDETLRRQGCALRVRSESGRSLLTFKGPMQASRMKMREEHETVVSDGDVLTRVLESLGLHVWFRYQKFREEFAAEDATIALDETPIGTFVEIEGGERAIVLMARALGRSESDYVFDSYRGLFLQRRERLGLSGADMMFADEWSQHSS